MRCRGLIPKHQILDNQAAAEYKAAIEASGITYEKVPPKEHRRNMTEKAIQTFKDHFVGVLSGCTPSMPIHLWCQLLPQVERQLLLLCQFRAQNTMTTTDTHLSPLAWKHWSMTNPTNATPKLNTAPKLMSWARQPNTIDVGNFGPPQHAPHASQGKLFFKHKYLTKPSITPEDQKIVAAACLTDTLQGIRSLNYTHLPSNRSVTSKTFSTRRPTPFTNVIPVHTSKGDTHVNSR